MLGKRGRFDVTVVNDNVLYAVAGSNGQTEELSVEKFDFNVGKWSYIASLPIRLSNIGERYLPLISYSFRTLGDGMMVLVS